MDQLSTFYTMNVHKAKYDDYGKMLKPQESWSENWLDITSLITLSQRNSISKVPLYPQSLCMLRKSNIA